MGTGDRMIVGWVLILQHTRTHDHCTLAKIALSLSLTASNVPSHVMVHGSMELIIALTRVAIFWRL